MADVKLTAETRTELGKGAARRIRRDKKVPTVVYGHGVDPLHVTYRGFDCYTPPPPAGGVTSLAILKTLEQVDLSTCERWGGPYYQLFAGAAMLCWQERARWLGDPAFVNVPIDRMLSDPLTT